MSEFRAFLLDTNDRIIRRYDFESDSHTAALEHAKQYGVVMTLRCGTAPAYSAG